MPHTVSSPASDIYSWGATCKHIKPRIIHVRLVFYKTVDFATAAPQNHKSQQICHLMILFQDKK